MDYSALYNLKLGEEFRLSSVFSYIRVPGGWVMIKDDGKNYGYACFIPWDSEFQPSSNISNPYM